MPRLETATINVVTTLPELEALRAEWSHFWRECEAATPFQTPEWLLPWARRWAPNSLLVITVRQRGRLVGLAPFFLYAPAGSPLRTVVILGNGLSDTLDGLATPGNEQAVVDSVLTTLDEHSAEWDACDWQQLRAESPLLNQAPPGSWADNVFPNDAWPTLSLPVEPRLSRHFARRLHADRARLERLGPVRFERAHADTFDACFDSLVALHAARWGSRDGQPGVLADPAVRAFHREAAAGLLALGVLRFYRLWIGDRVAAVYHGFLHRERASYYLGGFDPTLSAFGLGNQIVWHALRTAEQEGARVFDFLRGHEPYKYRWGAVDTPAFRRVLTQSVSTFSPPLP